MLYCIVLYCIVLYCIVLYCIVLYCIVLYCIVLYNIELYRIPVLYCTIYISYLTVKFSWKCSKTTNLKVVRLINLPDAVSAYLTQLECPFADLLKQKMTWAENPFRSESDTNELVQ